MSAHAPLDRLAPRDFYHQIDQIRANWTANEHAMSLQVIRLRRLFEHLPSPYCERAKAPLAVVARARIVNGLPWENALRELCAIVADWNSHRPPLLECDECGLIVRGHRRLLNHRVSVHGIEEAA
jgi:hypothetical protein